MAVESLTIPMTRSNRDAPAWLRLLRHPMALVGICLILLLMGLAVLAPVITYGDPTKTFPNGVDQLGVPHAPDSQFKLGADTLGRDVWTRVVYGTSRTLIIGLCAAVTSALIGSVLGLIGGYFGGRADRALTRFTEIVASLPTILLAITLAIVLPDRLPNFWLFERLNVNPDLSLPRLLLAIALVTWTRIARAVRGQTLSLKERDYVEAARAMGCSHANIIRRHLLPNVIPTIVSLATVSVASNILLEAGLSYLALGVDPAEPSWGAIISEGQPYLLTAPWIALVPGVAIVTAVTAFNLLGTALQEVLETRR